MHLTGGQRSSELQEPVRERGFAMINVGNDGKISYVVTVHGQVSGEVGVNTNCSIAYDHADAADNQLQSLNRQME